MNSGAAQTSTRDVDESALAKRASLIALLTSSSTLVCCTIPALLVALGAGAAVVSMTTAIPQLIWFSTHKEIVFGLAGFMLLVAGVMQWRARTAPCPIDPALAKTCMHTRAQSRRLYGISVALFLIGALFAFVLPLLVANAG